MADEPTTETIWIVNPTGAVHSAEADSRVLAAAAKQKEALSDHAVAKLIGAFNPNGDPNPKLIYGYLWGNPGALSAIQRQNGWRIATQAEIDDSLAAQIPNVLAINEERNRRDKIPFGDAERDAAIAEFYRNHGQKAPSKAQVKAATEPEKPAAPAAEPATKPAAGAPKA